MNFGEIVTVISSSDPTIDKYGDPASATLTRTDVPNCGVSPRTSSEPTERERRGVIVGLTLFAPLGTSISSTDIIEINGGGTVTETGLPITPNTALLYEVEGEPGIWRNPLTGTVFGVEVSLRRAEG
jgi:hypothetical protein